MIRVLTALVLLPVVVGTVWFLPPVATLVLALVTAGLAFWEYASLAAALDAHVPKVVAGGAVLAACATVGSGSADLEVVAMTAVIAIGALAVSAGQPGPAILRDAAAALLPVFYIGVPLGALAAVRVIGGREAVLLLMLTIVVSDSAQYYAGRAFGRRPLSPTISPKKTVEGAVGGLVCGTAAMTIGIVGDLFESLLKRSAGVKDSSAMIPGHGGVLDRIDSWLFAAPMYYVFVRWLAVRP
jgi:phosphatidate cytidylyltransferase